MDTICIMGLGYIGLPTAGLLAQQGFYVKGVDCVSEIVDTIRHGQIHIYEPDLANVVQTAVQSGQLTAALQPAEADIFIIAVPTPFKENHVPDLSYVEAAAKAIAPYVRNGNLVILESTSPVGTTEKIAGWLQTENPDINVPVYKGKDQKSEVYLAHCPERVLPGKILCELVANDRIIGGLDAASGQRAQNFYKQFVAGDIFVTDARTAEMTKLTENSFRDVNIAFANELSLICDKMDIDVWELIALANHHPRVNILQPGPGVGGHCIAVDPWFIVDSAPEDARLIHMARQVNDDKPYFVIDKIKKQAAQFETPVIACLGIAFKANIDDLRESPALEIADELAKAAVGQVLIVEPHIEALPHQLCARNNVRMVCLDEAIQQADIIVLLVDHDEFKDIDKDVMQGKILIDTRGIWK